MFSLAHLSTRGNRKSQTKLCFFIFTLVCPFFSQAFAQAPLNGTFTISQTAGDYDSFSDAVADLLSRGVDGPVTFEVDDGTYNEQFTITAVPGAGAGNPITFQPQSGNPCGVMLTFAATSDMDNWVVKLDGADYITFKNICFSATGTTHARVFHLLNGADHNTIMGCELNSASTTLQSFRLAILYLELKNDDNLISGNTFSDGSYGVYNQGLSTNPSSGNQISDNVFNGQYKTGIYLIFQDSPLVSSNRITSLDPSIGGYRGIHLEDCSNATTILKNKVNMSNGIGVFIKDCTGTMANPGLVANNFLLSRGSSTGNLVQPDGSTYFDIYYNTLLNTGNSSACIAVGSTSSNISIVDNIALNSAGGLVYDVPNSGALLASDYNDLHTIGATLASWDGSNYATLADLQAASGMDANSISKALSFSDPTSANLHLAGQSIGDTDLIGTPLTSVTDDYDGETRDAIFPYIGADENPQNPLPVELTSFTAAVGNRQVTLTWITATETNNLGFEIERQTTDESWRKIAFLRGHGTTTEPQFYEYIDANLNPGQYEYRLKQIDLGGGVNFSPILSIEIEPPEAFQLSQNYPNPFNPETIIEYQLATQSDVAVVIYNSRGEKIRSLVNESKPSGSFQISWDGKNNSGERVASGVYFYTLKVNGELLASKQMLLLK